MMRSNWKKKGERRVRLNETNTAEADIKNPRCTSKGDIENVVTRILTSIWPIMSESI